MPSPMTLATAINILELEPNVQYTKKEIEAAYRAKALKLHPDKGGTHEQFLSLCEACQTALQWINKPLFFFDWAKENKTEVEKVNITLSVIEAQATLYITISTVRKKLEAYGNSGNIALTELREIFDDIQDLLHKNILDDKPDVVLKELEKEAKDLNRDIAIVHSGPTPAFAAKIGVVFMTIVLAIIELLIVFLALPDTVELSTAALSAVIATPPVGGLLFGIYGYFAASSAHKNRLEQQQEMRKIVIAINALCKAIEKIQNKLNTLNTKAHH